MKLERGVFGAAMLALLISAGVLSSTAVADGGASTQSIGGWAMCDGEACTDAMDCDFKKKVIPTPRTVCTFSAWPAQCDDMSYGLCKTIKTYSSSTCPEPPVSTLAVKTDFCGNTWP